MLTHIKGFLYHKYMPMEEQIKLAEEQLFIAIKERNLKEMNRKFFWLKACITKILIK
jgi:hypothetical protein